MTRDAAVARLIVIGTRAVPRLLKLASNRDTVVDARIAALHALEGIGDVRALDTAAAALADSDEPSAIAAVAVLRRLLRSPRGVDALDRLTSAALDTARPRALRLAAVRAVSDLGAATVHPLFHALEKDPDPAIALAAGLGPTHAADPGAALRDAADGLLPDSPAPLRVALTEAGAGIPLDVVHQLIERVRIREGAESGIVRSEWSALRAAAHALLADRGSRVALYDLRETFETAREPLAVEFLGAARSIGDVGCLEAVAAACGHALEAGMRVDDWWCQRLVDVFRAIAARENVTRRSAAGKRITARWREASALLWP